MDIVFVLLPLTLLLAVIALLAFAWALKRGQFEDVETPALRVLLDEHENAVTKRTAVKETAAEEKPASE